MTTVPIEALADLERFPIHVPGTGPYADLVSRCRQELEETGLLELEGFLSPAACVQSVAEILPVMEREGYMHSRSHNIYFEDSVPGLDSGHPALRKFVTANRTVCGDRIAESIPVRLYEYPPLRAFIARVLGKDRLHLMEDRLAQVNVMHYRNGEALNWHFDRSEFTVTLLLQAPYSGGLFEYRIGLRNDHDPNYEGVAEFLSGPDPLTRRVRTSEGTLCVFKGKNTVHRVTPVEGDRGRMMAVFSYFETPGIRFSREEQIGFYGRTGSPGSARRSLSQDDRA